MFMDGSNIRYFLSQDNDAHWYLIPDERREEWYQFVNCDGYDDVPEFAQRLNTSHEFITFTDPKEQLRDMND